MQAYSDASNLLDSSIPPWPGGEIIPLPVRPNGQGFSAVDLYVLRHWCGDACRATVSETEHGSMALLHFSDMPWSVFALARDAGQVKLWNSVTLDDIGTFDTVRDALGAIPTLHGEFPEVACLVVPFPRPSPQAD